MKHWLKQARSGSDNAPPQSVYHLKILACDLNQRKAIHAIHLARTKGNQEQGNTRNIAWAIFENHLVAQEIAQFRLRDPEYFQVIEHTPLEVLRNLGGCFGGAIATTCLASQAYVKTRYKPRQLIGHHGFGYRRNAIWMRHSLIQCSEQGFEGKQPTPLLDTKLALDVRCKVPA